VSVFDPGLARTAAVRLPNRVENMA